MVFITFLDLRKLFDLKVSNNVFLPSARRFVNSKSIHFDFLLILHTNDLQLNLVELERVSYWRYVNIF